jgi:hypothetical protein
MGECDNRRGLSFIPRAPMVRRINPHRSPIEPLWAITSNLERKEAPQNEFRRVVAYTSKCSLCLFCKHLKISFSKTAWIFRHSVLIFCLRYPFYPIAGR